MRILRISTLVILSAVVVLGVAALGLQPVLAEPPDYCPQPAGPPGMDCRGCPTYEDPVVCTVICAGGPREKTFSNQCFAGCSGYIILGECRKTGG